jgi:hypothetical protein
MKNPIKKIKNLARRRPQPYTTVEFIALPDGTFVKKTTFYNTKYNV